MTFTILGNYGNTIASISGNWMNRENGQQPEDLSNGHHDQKSDSEMTDHSETSVNSALEEAVAVQNGAKKAQNSMSITGNWVKVEAPKHVMAS